MISSDVELPAPLAARLEDEARRAWPREACGVLLGRWTPHGAAVVDLASCPNRAPDPHAGFEIAAHDFAAAEARARARGLSVVGFWHSHPCGPARPSPADRAAAWPGYAMVVVSLEREPTEPDPR